MVEFTKADPLTPALTKNWDKPESWTLKAALANGAYEGLKKANAMEPADITQTVKDAGIRGRGGAGFPAGMKWSFLPPDDGMPRYLVVNADESEPGTCKDMPLLMADPHLLVEGIAIASRAIRCEHAFVYLRGEVVHVYRRLMNAINEATEAGLLGDLKITAHAGAGAYICGEETALLDSLEGRRGHPRLKPPFPAVAGLYARPSVVNNVETISDVALVFRNSAPWYASMGTERSQGCGIFSVSGHVNQPGQYEAPFGVTMRELLEFSGGIRDGHQLKFWTPGGSSTPLFTEKDLDVPLDYEGVAAAGSMLGTRALQVFDETTSVVRVVRMWTEFYQHESCGKCTPCREGTYWMKQIMLRLEAGKGKPGDIDLLNEVASNIFGRSFCALGDAAATPVRSAISLFRDEFEAGLTTPAWELFPYEHSTILAKGGVR
ncbi:NADH-quinone oxidoreductase subunit NuoF [Actinomycetaceae bacterium MB13-C1-2]|nr:NADH-quinone oxidoreductase subunit NuoF [Actinomycetaceae bacterium MB13-C1-2]